jgi:hypothetical protein
MNTIDVILDRFPKISDFIKTQIIPIEQVRFACNGVAEGLCSHPTLIDEFWVHSRGGKKFSSNPTPPDFFFLLGCQFRGDSEYLFFMWNRDGRRFWFYDQIFCTFGGASFEKTASKLDLALEYFRKNSGDVIYSGIWGWLDLHSRRFEKDDTYHRTHEEWESPTSAA